MPLLYNNMDINNAVTINKVSTCKFYRNSITSMNTCLNNLNVSLTEHIYLKNIFAFSQKSFMMDHWTKKKIFSNKRYKNFLAKKSLYHSFWNPRNRCQEMFTLNFSSSFENSLFKIVFFFAYTINQYDQLDQL